jgi:hypothetical protein
MQSVLDCQRVQAEDLRDAGHLGSSGSCRPTDTNSPGCPDLTALRIPSRSSGLTSTWSLLPSRYTALFAIMTQR